MPRPAGTTVEELCQNNDDTSKSVLNVLLDSSSNIEELTQAVQTRLLHSTKQEFLVEARYLSGDGHPDWTSPLIPRFFRAVLRSLECLKKITIQGAGLTDVESNWSHPEEVTGNALPMDVLTLIFEEWSSRSSSCAPLEKFSLQGSLVDIEVGDDVEPFADALRLQQDMREFRWGNVDFPNISEDEYEDTTLGDHVVSALSTLPVLECVELQCEIGMTSGCRPGISVPVVGTLYRSTCLKEIILTVFFGDDHVVAMARALESEGSTVQTVCLGQCDLQRPGVVALARMLRQNRTLERLSLQGLPSYWKEDGKRLEDMAGALQHNEALKELKLVEHSSMRKQVLCCENTAAAFVTLLQSNFVLEDVHLPGQDSSGSQNSWGTLLELYARLNGYGRGRVLQGSVNASQQEWFELLSKASKNDDLEALFCVLQMQPSLCQMRDTKEGGSSGKRKRAS